MSASAECTSQNYTDSSIIPCLWCSVLRKQLRSSNKLKRFNGAPKKIFGSKNSHHNQKSTHYEEKKTINLRMFLCVLIGKKRLTTQSIQKSIIWCPISIKNKFYVLRLAKDLWLISLFKTLSFFISSLISFIIFEILLFSLTLKSLIYFIPM